MRKEKEIKERLLYFKKRKERKDDHMPESVWLECVYGIEVLEWVLKVTC